jgi:uncharacterized membrane protein
MTNLNNSLKLPVSKAVWIALFTTLVGFADALYLTINHYRQAIPPCAIGNCETVLTSKFAEWNGIPLALAGVIGYLVIGILLVAFLDSRSLKVLGWAGWLAIASFGVGVVLVSLMIFVVHAICIYCMFSALCDLILLFCGISFLNKKYQSD